MKHKLWITIATYIAYCINKELYKAIEYLKTQVEVLIEQQEKQNKRILLTTGQRMRIAAKAKRLSRKMLEQYTGNPQECQADQRKNDNNVKRGMQKEFDKKAKSHYNSCHSIGLFLLIRQRFIFCNATDSWENLCAHRFNTF